MYRSDPSDGGIRKNEQEQRSYERVLAKVSRPVYWIETPPSRATIMCHALGVSTGQSPVFPERRDFCFASALELIGPWHGLRRLATYPDVAKAGMDLAPTAGYASEGTL
ncbi:hypothetical protein WN48_01131 [Eufriesea mexicana]|nr:hypothetical protein WN48_01131 [Eufriesea mexicana]